MSEAPNGQFQQYEKQVAAESGPLVSKAQADLATAKDFVINDQAMRDLADQEHIRLKKQKKAIVDARLNMTRPIDEAKARVMEFFRPAIETIDAAIEIYAQGILTFDTEQERLRRIEEARQRELARQEQERLEREAAERAKAIRLEAERLQREAEQARAAGNTDHAAEVAAQAEAKQAEAATVVAEVPHVPVPIVAPVGKLKGASSSRDIWEAVVVDAAKVPREYLIPDMDALNALAKVRKAASTIPGVEFRARKTLVQGWGK